MRKANYTGKFRLPNGETFLTDVEDGECLDGQKVTLAGLGINDYKEIAPDATAETIVEFVGYHWR